MARVDEEGRQVRELRELMDAGARTEGITESPFPGLAYYRASAPEPRAPMLLDPTLCIVASGEKRAHVGSETYRYDPHHYRVLAVPLPVEIEVTRASVEEPLLAIALDIDLSVLTEVVLEIEDTAPPVDSRGPSRGMYVSDLGRDLRGAVARLLRSVHDPRRREVLAPMAVREILFHLASGPDGDTLRALALRDGKSRRVTRALRFIQSHFADSLDVSAIAKAAYTSASALHHDFKAVTSTTPMQYLKRIRLHEARRLMLHDDRTAASAARAVGYQSPSQFSREYRRMFGAPPAADVRTLQKVAPAR